MTPEEKAQLLSGKDFWHTNELERLGIPSMMLTDGPHGLRKQGVESDHLGIGASLPATCFPTAAATSCSFDTDLLRDIGQALGEECRKEDVAVLLGPAMNIKRNPLCGRNFEYISEDPYLTAILAAAFINGVQSQGVGTSPKHFAANSQEKYRNWQNSVVDERALREIYLYAFEHVARQAKPWTMMTAYNRLNGVFCSESRELLLDIARGEWGFDGLFVTDWGAMSDPVASFKNGLNLEMPGTCKGTDKEILSALEEGALSTEELDMAVSKILELAQKYTQGKQITYHCDMDAHLRLAQKAAEQSAVLLKNGGALPLGDDSLLVIGDMAKRPRYQGAGSSKVCPSQLDSFCEALDEAGVSYKFAQGYPEGSKQVDEGMILQAAQLAAQHKQVVVFAGLPDIYESEGYDRESMELPAAHNRLVEAVAAANPNTVVVLQGGSPAILPWRDKANAILLAYLSGCQGGKAVLRLLRGEVNPCGKLAETWPLTYADVACADLFAADAEHVQYRESIYVGYRWYESMEKEVAYPFGYGLSYTRFEYSDLSIEGEQVHCTITNTGSRRGKEIVQLYASMPDSAIYRPFKELKAFTKVSLEAGESKRVTLVLPRKALQVYDARQGCWQVEGGQYTIFIGASSRDIRLKGTLQISEGDALEPLAYTPKAFTQSDFEKLLGKAIPADSQLRPFTINSLLGHTASTLFGRILLFFSARVAGKKMGGDEQSRKMAEETMKAMPIRGLGMGGGTRNTIHGMTDIFNGHLFRGLGKILRDK